MTDFGMTNRRVGGETESAGWTDQNLISTTGLYFVLGKGAGEACREQTVSLVSDDVPESALCQSLGGGQLVPVS